MATKRRRRQSLAERIDTGILSTANVRRFAQAAAFVLFVVLLVLSIKAAGNTQIYRGTLFFELNPLILVATYLSAHAVEAALFLSVITALATALFGRFFCGWVCPFGAVHTFAGFLGRKLRIGSRRARDVTPRLFGLKYVLLGAVLAAAMFGGQLVGYLDPIALMTRTFTTAVLPATAWVTNSIYVFLGRFDFGMAGNTALGVLHLPYENAELAGRFYQGGLFVGTLFLVFVALNLYRERFFCRYLCPLGALLAVLAKLGLVTIRSNSDCTECTVCAKSCPTAAEPWPQESFRLENCIFCYTCTERCPEGGLAAAFARPGTGASRKPDHTRRDLVVGAAAGALLLPLAKSPWRGKRVKPDLIRPPGASSEQHFLSKCVRCGACMRACPTNVLQPAVLEAGFDGFWTPVMKYRFGYCLYGCTLCSEACPTGAIERLALEDKKKLKIGQAFFDRNRCLPHAFGRDCTVCEEHCPTAPKAIVTRKETVLTPDGEKVVIHVPEVEPERCIGCGICENVCPIVDMAGIRVTSVGEARSDANQFLAK